jgi:hypothetical protein
LQQPDGTRGEQLRGAWGFSDGQQVYCYYHKRYWQLARQGDSFGFVGPSVADPGAVSTAAVLGGLAGGAIAAASTSGRPTDYTLDLLTGRVSTLATEEYNPTPDTVLVHVYCRKSSLSTKPEPVYLKAKLPKIKPLPYLTPTISAKCACGWVLARAASWCFSPIFWRLCT